jgi:bifunctional ADP-heptose synthase (sugar kinase/adenylyltransferase)
MKLEDSIEFVIWDCHDGENGHALDVAVDDVMATIPKCIKPLVWEGPNCGILNSGKRYSNDNAAYSIIIDVDPRGNKYTTYFGGQLILKNTRDKNKAVAAANKHHADAVMDLFN